jgi:hypothetical protein
MDPSRNFTVEVSRDVTLRYVYPWPLQFHTSATYPHWFQNLGISWSLRSAFHLQGHTAATCKDV